MALGGLCQVVPLYWIVALPDAFARFSKAAAIAQTFEATRFWKLPILTNSFSEVQVAIVQVLQDLTVVEARASYSLDLGPNQRAAVPNYLSLVEK